MTHVVGYARRLVRSPLIVRCGVSIAATGIGFRGCRLAAGDYGHDGCRRGRFGILPGEHDEVLAEQNEKRQLVLM